MSPFIRNKPYTGPIQAVVLDWAGTAVDFGCIGPAAVFVEVFAKFGISVTLAEVRRFMGLAKKDHIRKLCALPGVVEQWRKKYVVSPAEAAIERLYTETEPMMAATVTRYADPIPGLLETVAELRRQGIKIGSSTGYTTAIMAALAPAAKKNGYAPDVTICSSDVPAGRPYPWMCYLNAIHLEVYPMEAVVKIGDTISDIDAGLNAGAWTIGLTESGNELGLSREEISQLPAEELKARTDAVREQYLSAGAHYVVAGIWEVLPIIEKINTRLAQGETPDPGVSPRG
jgi:phosphonoacetaldehyde hydrolase